MGANLQDVTARALGLLVASGVLNQKEMQDALDQGYDDLVELLVVKEKEHKDKFNEQNRE